MRAGAPVATGTPGTGRRLCYDSTPLAPVRRRVHVFDDDIIELFVRETSWQFSQQR